jgi:hypothetical protein
MTFATPPERVLREPVDRPGARPSRRVARIAGIFMVITFISIPALPLYDQVLNHTNFIVGSGGNARVYLGALFEVLTLMAGIGFAVTLYPVLNRQSQSLALGYVTVRYFIVKGFKPSSLLYDDGRQSGVDGPLIPVLMAPEMATR